MSLELNKIAAAVLTAGVVAMGSGFIADLLVAPHHGDGENAYPVQVAEADGDAASAPEEEPGLQPVLPLLASASVSDGESLTRACAACHSFEQGGPTKVGPNLWNIVGAPHAHVEDYAYSDALASIEEPWTYENLNAFLENPSDYAPGTKMSYGGMPDVEDRANLIAYMRSLSDDPAPLPTEEEIQAVTGGAETADAEGEAPAEETEMAEADMAEGEETQAAEAAAEAEAEAEGAPDEAQQQAAAAEEAAEEAGEAAADAASEGAEQAADAAEEAAGDAAEAAQETAEAAQEGAEQVAEEAAGQAEDAAEEAAGETQQAAADSGGEAGGGQSGVIQQIAAADPAAGEGGVRACMACHSFNEGGPNKVGPNLYDVMGAPIGGDDSYNYSQVFQEMNADGMIWTYEHMWEYLQAPMDWAPGTKMSYGGVRDEQTLAEIVAYLRSLSGDPAPLEPLQ